MSQKKDTIAGKRPARSAEKKSRSFTRKIAPLRGGLVREMIRCGRPNCKCASGSLHGPYHYRVWMVQGRRYKTYVKKAELSAVQASINKCRQLLAEVRQVNREARENWGTFKAQLRQLDQLLGEYMR